VVGIRNRLPIFAAHPDLAAARNRLMEAGARWAGLCGSGSALFGVFESEAQAKEATRGWRFPWLSFVCRPC
jgi:4-diphosphocytidyl-2C-methyl-D-erythritol kinase